MPNPEISKQLFQYIRKNNEYLLTGRGLDEKQLTFISEHNQFRKIFYNTLTDQKILKNIPERSAEIDPIIEELSKFSRTKIRVKLLQAYQQLCSSLRVLNLFSAYHDFFLSPFENRDELDSIFNSNQEFLALNQKLANIFHDEDKRAYNGLPLCKEAYQFSLKAIGDSKTANFYELISFFEKHPLIRNFFDDHLTEITKYAKLFAEKNGSYTMRLFKPIPIKIILKRKLEPPASTSKKTTYTFK